MQMTDDLLVQKRYSGARLGIGLAMMVIGAFPILDSVVFHLYFSYSIVWLFLLGFVGIGFRLVINPYIHVCARCQGHFISTCSIPFSGQAESKVVSVAQTRDDRAVLELIEAGAIPESPPSPFVTLVVNRCAKCGETGELGVICYQHTKGGVASTKVPVEYGAGIPGSLIPKLEEAAGRRWAMTKERAGFDDPLPPIRRKAA
jgi:hypothetical protein